MRSQPLTQSPESRLGAIHAAGTGFLSVRLQDGRMLAWSEFGAPRGFPIIYVHEAGSCRLEAAFFEAEARRSGFRLLAVDRPGLGESEGYAKMTRDSCADDLLQLSAHLGLKEFGILSSGAGLSIALAAAAQAPARVKLVLGVSSQLPVCSTQESRACRVLRSTLATALQCMLALRLAFANSTPEQYLRRLSESFAYADRRLLDDPAIRCKLTQSTCEAVRHGVSGVARDTVMALAPLNLPVASLSMPVHVWLGGVEHLAPYSSVPSYIHCLPRGSLHRLANHGRYFFWRYSESVFATAVRILQGDVTANQPRPGSDQRHVHCDPRALAVLAG